MFFEFAKFVFETLAPDLLISLLKMVVILSCDFKLFETDTVPHPLSQPSTRKWLVETCLLSEMQAILNPLLEFQNYNLFESSQTSPKPQDP